MSKVDTAESAPDGGRRPGRLSRPRDEGPAPGRPGVGDQVVVTVARPIAPGSILSVEPGDTGTVISVSGDECAARFHGLSVLLPVECVQKIGGAGPARPRVRSARAGAGPVG